MVPSIVCDSCGDRLRDVIVSGDLRTLARSGSLQVVISDQFVRHAAEMGQQVRARLHATHPSGFFQGFTLTVFC